MKTGKKRQSKDDVSLPHPSYEDLRGRQSVRATFRLSNRAIHALSILSVQLGIKQKSLFDHLLEDMESLSRLAQDLNLENLDRPNRVQKTYVLSRRTLACLEETSRSFRTPRDALVEYSIRRLLPLITRERERHRNRKALLNDFEDYVKEGERILKKAKASLGEDDPVYRRFESAVVALAGAKGHIENFVEKGSVIEDFDSGPMK